MNNLQARIYTPQWDLIQTHFNFTELEILKKRNDKWFCKLWLDLKDEVKKENLNLWNKLELVLVYPKEILVEYWWWVSKRWTFEDLQDKTFTDLWNLRFIDLWNKVDWWVIKRINWEAWTLFVWYLENIEVDKDIRLIFVDSFGFTQYRILKENVDWNFGLVDFLNDRWIKAIWENKQVHIKENKWQTFYNILKDTIRQYKLTIKSNLENIEVNNTKKSWRRFIYSALNAYNNNIVDFKITSSIKNLANRVLNKDSDWNYTEKEDWTSIYRHWLIEKFENADVNNLDLYKEQKEEVAVNVILTNWFSLDVWDSAKIIINWKFDYLNINFEGVLEEKRFNLKEGIIIQLKFSKGIKTMEFLDKFNYLQENVYKINL